MRKLVLFMAFLLLAAAVTAYEDPFASLAQGLKDPPPPPPAYVPREIIITSVPVAQPAPEHAPLPTRPPTPVPLVFEPTAPQPAVEPAPALQLSDFSLQLNTSLADPRVKIIDHEDILSIPAVKALDPLTGRRVNLTRQGVYDLAVNLTPHRHLVLRDALLTSQTRFKFEELAPSTRFVNAIAIDLSGVNFTRATYVGIAQRHELFKCKDWNFTAQDCAGAWEKIQDLAPGQRYAVPLGPNDPSLAEGGGVFFDGFENGLAANNWTVNGTGAKWTNSTLNPFNGTKHANAPKTGKFTPSSLRINISTANYTGIGVRYARRLVGLDTGDDFAALWYNGTAWHVFEHLNGSTANDPAYVIRDFSLNGFADNNPNFALEFMCKSDANPEHCRVDDVRVFAGALPPAPKIGCTFFDGFENGLAANNWTVNGTGATWTNSTLNPFNGTQHANAQQTGSAKPTSMRVNISTQNLSAVRIRYERQRVGIDPSDEFAALWHNGTTWQVLEQTGGGAEDDLSYVQRDFVLDASANNNSQLSLEFLCLADASTEHCRIDDVCVNGTFIDSQPPVVHAINISSTTPFVGDSVCLLANVTDKTGVQSVTAQVLLPNGSTRTLPLLDGLTCNSPENDSVFSNHLFVEQEGVHAWTNVGVADAFGNAAAVSANLTFAGLLGTFVAANNMPPNLSRYNNGTVIDLALINTSNNVYATQNIPTNAQTFMYFNWTLNITGNVLNSNVSIEHSYSATSSMTSTLQRWNGTSWNNACTLNTSTTDVVDRCDLDGFVSTNVSVINNLQLRINTTRGSGGGARTQNVDHVSLGVENVTPGAIVGCPVVINQSAPLALSITSVNGCIIINASNLALDCQGFSITGNRSGIGINATRVRNVTIKNCRVLNFSDGILFSQVNDSLIFNNTVLNNSDEGLDIRATNFSTIERNNISRNFDNNIELTFGFGNNITLNVIERVAGAATAQGLALFSNTRQTLVVNNTLFNNQDDGIRITGPDNSIVNNTIVGSGDDGIEVADTTGTTMVLNLVQGSSDDGIVLTSGNQSTIANNTITASGDDGVFLQMGSSHNIIRANLVQNHTAAGSDSINVFTNLADQFNNTLEQNVILRTGDDGIQVLNRTFDIRIINNTILTTSLATSDGDGILVTGASTANITDNNISDTGLRGIRVSDSFNVSVGHNSVKNVTERFIQLEDVNASVIINNTVFTNNLTELHLVRANGTAIVDSTHQNYSFITSALTFRDTDEGEIVFLNQSISRTARNLSFDIRIGNNSIFVNDSNANAFNQSANLTIFNINVSSPQIDIDYLDNGIFASCPSSICALIQNNPSQAFVKFNVTGFSTYRITGVVADTAILTGTAFDIDGNDVTTNVSLSDALYASKSFLVVLAEYWVNTTINLSSHTVVDGNFTCEFSQTGISLLGDVTQEAWNGSAWVTACQQIDDGILPTADTNYTCNVRQYVENQEVARLRCRATSLIPVIATFRFDLLNLNITKPFQVTNCPVTINRTGTLPQNLVASLGAGDACVQFGADGIFLNCKGFSIRGNNNGKGVDVRHKSGVTVKDCSIAEFDDGIFLSNASGSRIFNTTVSNSSDDGIDANDVNFTSIEQSVIENSFDNGIVLTRSDQNNITANTVVNASGAATGFCIELFNGSDNNRVINNTAQRCQDDGILMTAGSNNNLALNNTLENNGDDGIGVTDSVGNNLTKNNIRNSNDTGIALSGGNGTFIAYNTIINSTDDGILLSTGSSHNILRANIIANQTGGTNNEGINILSNIADQHNNTVELNNITNIGDDGIQFVNRSFDAVVRQNIIKGTGLVQPLGDGILLVGVRRGNITGNSLSDLGNRGIRVSSSANISVEHNTLANVSDRLINIENSNATIVFNNTIITPAENITGLRLFDVPDAEIIDTDVANYTIENTSLSLKKTGKGALKFIQKVTRSGRNLSKDISITNDSIFVNSTSAPEFNVSANVTFFDINFSDILIDSDFEDDGTFVECPDAVCTLLENNQTTRQVRFNVTQFSRYRVILALVRALKLSPADGAVFFVNDTVDIRLNVTASSTRRIDQTLVNITLPNGTTLQNLLLNETKDLFNKSFLGTGLVLRGRYNITFIANDSKNVRNATVISFFNRQAKDVIDIPKPVFEEDGNGTAITRYVQANYSITVTANVSGVLNLTITSQDNNSRFRTITVANHDERSPAGALQIDDGNPQGKGTFTRYALEFATFNFTTLSITLNTTGTELSKCGTWNFTGQDCLGNWTKLHNTQPGQPLTLNFTPTDPGFAESSPAVDVGMTPLSFRLNETLFENETFVLAWVDNTTSSVRFRVQHTNGSVAVNDTIVDSTADDQSRVSVGALNDTHFVVAWIDGPDDDVTMIVYAFNGSAVKNITNITDVNANVGTNTDVDVTTMEDRFIVCYANDADNDADFDIYNKSDYTAIVIELNSDLNMNPEAPLQNLADCAGVNSTRWVHNWYDAGSTDAAKADIKNETGIFITGGFSIDNDIGDAGQVAVSAINNDRFVLAWYDAADQDITIAIRSINNDIILDPTDVDTSAGNASRVAIAAVKPNQTSPQEFFALAWWNQSSSTIMAAVFNNTGGIYTPPFVVNGSVNAFYQLLDVAGDEPVTNNSVCPGNFIVSYSNGTNQGVFAGFDINGSGWEGECGLADLEINSTLIGFNVTNPQEDENITINITVCNPGNRIARNFNITFADGNETTGIIFANVTNLDLTRRRCITVNATYVSIIGNRTISIVVDAFLPNGTTKEKNETNNLAIRTLNVKATTFYTGTLFGNVTLEAFLNETKFNYGFNNSGNIYIFDINSTFNFSHLQALGRNRSGAIASNDFGDVDLVLNQTNFNDSVRILWGGGSNSTPIALRNFTIFNNTILDVPIINSTNSSVFITGIFWDMADDTNNEFDTAEREDLVFVGNIDVNQSGGLNQTADYEMRVATLVRTLRGSTNQTAFIAELQ